MQDFIHVQPAPTYIHSSFRQFYDGEKHIDRRIKDYVLLFILKNTLYFSEDGEEAAVSEGEWYIQLPDLFQKGSRGCPAPYYYYIHFQMDDCMETRELFSLPLRGRFHPAYYQPLFEELDACSRQTGLRSDYLGQQSVFLKILSNLVRTYNQPMTKNQILVGKVTDYLSEHFCEDITAKDIHEVFHYAPDYLSHILREEKGVSFRQILQDLRVNKAKELLTYTDLPITEISLQTGYHDHSVFFKTFKEYTSISPRDWRKISRGIS